VLVDEDRIAVRIGRRKVRRTRRRFIGLRLELEAAALQRLLDLADVVEARQRLGGAVPTRNEGQGILLERPLEQTDAAWSSDAR
jgi:hypothetical protein